MHTRIALSTIFECSLERAFKSPMLCDVTKVHTGLGPMPRITHTTHDENWGQPGAIKKVYGAPSLAFRGGEASTDQVIERRENAYWKIEVTNFTAWMLGFNRFVGEWQTTELAPNRIRIDYTYTLYTDGPWLYPLNWLFTQTFWRVYMKQVLENVRKLAYTNAPYLYP